MMMQTSLLTLLAVAGVAADLDCKAGETPMIAHSGKTVGREEVYHGGKFQWPCRTLLGPRDGC
jgi:hypothetical protein